MLEVANVAKRLAVVSVLCVLLTSILSGCGSTNGGSAANTNASEQGGASKTAEGEQSVSDKTYTTREIWCKNADDNIYGVAYVPNAKEKAPLVIFSHELGNSHTAGERYAERLAEAGYAAYVFDFRGGTVGGNKSDGSNVGMSVMTEASDLEAVLDAAAGWDFVDPDRIVLLGGSQGAVVTSVAGTRNADKIAGMMLMYPPFAIPDDMHAMFSSKESVPEEFDLFGGWIRVGRNYATDVWDLDCYRNLAGYAGDVLLLHGDRDTTVDIAISKRAAEVIPSCEFHTIAGGGHEFFGPQFEDAMGHILSYMERHVAEGAKEAASSSQDTQSAQSGESPQKPSMKIGDTSVNVEWEDNESVSALMQLASASPLTIQMSMYGGFEQVGSIGQSLPRNDSQMTTEAGDIVLYSGNQIVVFYGSNSWAYTKLGHISDKSAQEMADLLGSGDVTITIGG